MRILKLQMHIISDQGGFREVIYMIHLFKQVILNPLGHLFNYLLSITSLKYVHPVVAMVTTYWPTYVPRRPIDLRTHPVVANDRDVSILHDELYNWPQGNEEAKNVPNISEVYLPEKNINYLSELKESQSPHACTLTHPPSSLSWDQCPFRWMDEYCKNGHH